MLGIELRFFFSFLIKFFFVKLGLGYCFFGFNIRKVLVIFGGIVFVVIFVVFVFENIVIILLYFIICCLSIFCIFIVWLIFVFGICIVCSVMLFLLSWGINLDFNLLLSNMLNVISKVVL